jgi:Zn-dependent protease
MIHTLDKIYHWWLVQSLSIRVTFAALFGACATIVVAGLSAGIGWYELASIMVSLAIVAVASAIGAGFVSLFLARDFWFRR